MKCYVNYSDQKSPKKLRELKKLAEVCQETVNPVKTEGTRWIDLKVHATKVFLENYGIYIQHLEQVNSIHLFYLI